LFFQDESRFGLITKQKRVITAKGIKPIGIYKHSYQYKWLWGSFSPFTGEQFCMTTDTVSKDWFIKYLNEFSRQNPKELKILMIDNAAFHSTKNVQIPKNIKLIPIPPYTPELNPAEKIWQWMKDKIAMKIFDTLEQLENRLHQLILNTEQQIIKSIVHYKLYIDQFNKVFKS